MLSGKIASSELNLETGFVERVFFGDWSLDLKAGRDAKFSAEFVARRIAETKEERDNIMSKSLPMIKINNLKVNGFQRNNEDVVLRGMVDVSLQKENIGQNSSLATEQEIFGKPFPASSHTWEKIPVSIGIVSKSSVIIVSFDKYSPVNEALFHTTPITGMVWP